MSFPTCPNCGRADCLGALLDPSLVEGYTAISFEPGLDISPADLGINLDIEAILAELAYEEFKAQVENALAEVEVGNILSPAEGATLAEYIAVLEAAGEEASKDAEDYRQQLVDEEQAHAETLASLYDAQDEIAELKAQVAKQEALLALANVGLTLAAGAIEDAARERFAIRLLYGI